MCEARVRLKAPPLRLAGHRRCCRSASGCRLLPRHLKSARRLDGVTPSPIFLAPEPARLVRPCRGAILAVPHCLRNDTLLPCVLDLPPDVASKLSDVPFSPSDTTAYQHLKTKELQRFMPAERARLQQLLEEGDLGDRRPF
ncbi:hypothetical protein HPB52_023226 [Rhipicephalus sanguineus]|uniref:Uncharacterized protein n=1 Tax=Rhipicephalus sanguineus TaxID=34632 RepID=A0A9D4QH90_RHISA|nr:hypothetical protein HPB52_023226 [Rhipicephalus sanguineus]